MTVIQAATTENRSGFGNFWIPAEPVRIGRGHTEDSFSLDRSNTEWGRLGPLAIGFPLMASLSGGGRTGILVGGVAVIAAVVGLLLFLRAKERQENWKKSEGANDMGQIELASSQRNVATLDELGKKARARQSQAKDPVQRAYDGFAAARAELNENRLSSDVSSRIGQQPFSSWEGRLREAEARAIQNGFEGELLLLLSPFQTELAEENRVAESLGKEIEAYRKESSGSEMRGLIEKAKAELGQFKAEEIGREDQLLGRLNRDIRSRIRQKLLASDPTFGQKLERVVALSQLRAELVQPALQSARVVNRQLGVMIDARQNELLMLANAERQKREAEQHKRTPVTDSCTMRWTEEVQATDNQIKISNTSAGNCGEVFPEIRDVQTDPRCQKSIRYEEREAPDAGISLSRRATGTYTCTVVRDLSDPYLREAERFMSLAMVNAQRAREAALQAQPELRKLSSEILRLYRNDVIRGEQLTDDLPSGEIKRRIEPGQGWQDYFYNPFFERYDDIVDFFLTLDERRLRRSATALDRAVEEKFNFEPILRSLDRLDTKVQTLHDHLEAETNRQIDHRIEQQKAEARSRP